MLTAPILDSALRQLEVLAPLLSAELPATPATAAALSDQARACKEALMTARILADKLRVVRLHCISQRMGHGSCTTCDGD